MTPATDISAPIVALDAGGTSTRCLVARPDGTVLGHGRAGPGNHILSGWEPARKEIAAALTQACTAAHVDLTEVSCAVAGSAGIGPNGEGRELVEAFLTDLAPQAHVRATGDMVAAFAGALDTDVGVVVAAGTGSVCYGRNAAGDSRQVGGWGHILGDEGSAYDVAVRALRAGAHAVDGRGPPTTLTSRIIAALGARNFVEVAFRVYAEPMSRDALAGLATIVTTAAVAEDAVARQVLADAGSDLGKAVITTLRGLRLADTAAPVAYTGAVFEAGELILAPFRDTVSHACPQARIAGAQFSPVVGAFKLALRDAGIAFTADTAARLRATFGGAPP